MAKIEKDQFETFLEQNKPVEEPSAEVFTRIQQQAIWNQKPSSTGRLITPLIAIALIGLLIFAAYLGRTDSPENNTPGPAPVFEKPLPAPTDVIASAANEERNGVYCFMKWKSDDFDLSFNEYEQTMLEISRELNNI